MTADPWDTGANRAGALPHPLVVRSTQVENLPDSPTALIDLLPQANALSWVRKGDGLVGWGEAVRFETSGPGRFADAESAWLSVLERAVVRDEVHLPGSGPVAFGSFAFDDGASVLVVPRVIVGRRDGVSWITTIDTAGSLSSPPADALRRAVAGRAPVRSPGVVTYADGALSGNEWKAAVRSAVERIQAGELDKVVLARDVLARTGRTVDPRYLLLRLASEYHACWTFSVCGMLGATPELLIRSERGLVTSRVLAGTIARGKTDDAALLRAAQLARSSKDLEEHEYAVASVAGALEPFCRSMNVPDAPFVLHLPNVMHLASDVTGVLREIDETGTGGTEGSGTATANRVPTSLSLAAALHPSAAVCGTPTPVARDLIREIEGMDRARYAGPVGWLGADGAGEWGIALRSAELQNDPRSIRLFAGCGIVAASDPEVELAESEAKLEPLRYALAATPPEPSAK